MAYFSAFNNSNNNTDANQSPPQQGQNEPSKHCWVCFANEDDDYSAQWTSPCKCRGTAKWVHKTCLQRWIDEKQQGNSSVEVSCPQCNNAYIILYPNSGVLVRFLDTIDRIICKSCPFIAGGILVGSVYWTAVTYGAVTIMQVLGHKEGLSVMEKADPLIMLIGLPTIPVMLMLGRLIRWEDAVLKFWRKHSTKLPLINLIFPNLANSQYLPRTPAVAYASNSDPVSFTRTICGGLILPTIATIFGKLLFQRVNSNFQRSIIGGIAFIGLKGIFKIYYKQQQYLRQAHRQIKNYDTGAPSTSSSSSTQTSSAQQSSGATRRQRQDGSATSTGQNLAPCTSSSNSFSEFTPTPATTTSQRRSSSSKSSVSPALQQTEFAVGGVATAAALDEDDDDTGNDLIDTTPKRSAKEFDSSSASSSTQHLTDVELYASSNNSFIQNNEI